jgi:alpha/beta superfamily hydrolase
LAALAAPRCTGAAALIAVAPIVSGRRYLKELRNFELAAGHIGAAAAAGAAQAASGDGGNFEVSGFVLSGATVAALSQLDLANLVGAPVPELLIIDRNDSTAGRAWSDQLAGLGVKTGYRALPGFVEMMMRPPDLTVTPAAMIEATREWLTALQESTTTTAADTVRPAGSLSASATPAARPLPAPAPAQAMPVECPVFFGSDILLFGIITEPPKEEARRRGVILLNSGGDYHIGPRRMYVSLARTWARRGYFVLRMDLSGLGDSARRSGRPGNEIFPPGAIEDIEAGVEFMRARHGLREITVGGMCTGAFHALQAAAEGLPINRILMINPLNFFWEEGAEPTAVQDWEIVQKPAAYRSQMFSAHAWRRVLSGDVNLWRVLKIYLHSPWLALQTRLRDLARRLNIPVGNDLAELLESIAARGVRIVFVFSDGDAGINLLKTQSGMPVEALSKRYRFRIIAGADHNFTRSEPRSALERVLSEELFARNQQEPV